MLTTTTDVVGAPATVRMPSVARTVAPTPNVPAPRRSTNLDGIRLLAAGAVVVGHAYDLTGRPAMLPRGPAAPRLIELMDASRAVVGDWVGGWIYDLWLLERLAAGGGGEALTHERLVRAWEPPYEMGKWAPSALSSLGG